MKGFKKGQIWLDRKTGDEVEILGLEQRKVGYKYLTGKETGMYYEVSESRFRGMFKFRERKDETDL